MGSQLSRLSHLSFNSTGTGPAAFQSKEVPLTFWDPMEKEQQHRKSLLWLAKFFCLLLKKILANKSFVLTCFKKCSLSSQFLTLSRIILSGSIPSDEAGTSSCLFPAQTQYKCHLFTLSALTVFLCYSVIPFWNVFVFQNKLKSIFFFAEISWVSWKKSFSCLNWDVSVCFSSIIRYYLNLRDLLQKCFLLHLWFYAPHPSEFRAIWLPKTEVFIFRLEVIFN